MKISKLILTIYSFACGVSASTAEANLRSRKLLKSYKFQEKSYKYGKSTKKIMKTYEPTGTVYPESKSGKEKSGKTYLPSPTIDPSAVSVYPKLKSAKFEEKSYKYGKSTKSMKTQDPTTNLRNRKLLKSYKFQEKSYKYGKSTKKIMKTYEPTGTVYPKSGKEKSMKTYLPSPTIDPSAVSVYPKLKSAKFEEKSYKYGKSTKSMKTHDPTTIYPSEQSLKSFKSKA